MSQPTGTKEELDILEKYCPGITRMVISDAIVKLFAKIIQDLENK